MLQTLIKSAEQRLRHIEMARQAVLHDQQPDAAPATPTWITRSWQRCLGNGQLPHQSVSFDQVSLQAMRRSEEANHILLNAARPALKRLGQAIAETRYFAILTNADGVVVDVGGPIDRSDPRANVIARVGVDLSERSVGTTAISAALAEKHPVWLHQGEHFFNANAVYSCAGAPLFGPDGRVVGMLDLTGIEEIERPELKYLVAQSARSIENTLTINRAHQLLVRLNWPGRTLGDETDGLVCLCADGWVTGANQAARHMIAHLKQSDARPDTPIHSSELFAMPFEMLFDAAGRESYGMPAPIDVPLWSGLRLNAISVKRGHQADDPISVRGALTHDHPSLREVETALIRKAVAQAKGNVMHAARELGISRATVYRKLGTRVKVQPGRPGP